MARRRPVGRVPRSRAATEDLMSDRKYRQRGYQDDNRERPRAARPAQPREPGAPRGRPDLREPRAPNVPGFSETIRCANCGETLTSPFTPSTTCTRCGAAVHSCAQCTFFDPGARFECMQNQHLTARVTPKDAGNECPLYEPRVKVERQTTSKGPADPKSAFDDLFKF
jgi:hypothetical protein